MKSSWRHLKFKSMFYIYSKMNPHFITFQFQYLHPPCAKVVHKMDFIHSFCRGMSRKILLEKATTEHQQFFVSTHELNIRKQHLK